MATDPDATVSCDGVTELIEGAGLLILKVAGAEDPPPGVGLLTEICTVPVLASSEGATVICSCVALTKVNVLGAPFQRTVEEAIKPVPVTAICSDELPTSAESGDKLDTAGLGF
jgi:hypothetical protein